MKTIKQLTVMIIIAITSCANRAGGQTSVVLSAVSIVELSTELQPSQAKSEQKKYKSYLLKGKTKANLNT